MAKKKAEPKGSLRTSRVSKPATKSKSTTKRVAWADSGASGPTASGKAQSDWRAATLAHLRGLIFEADPEMSEEQKWKKPSNPAGVPTFSHGGIVCTGETYKQVVKFTFAKGASLKDPHRLFNSSLEGNARRAIDIREGEEIDDEAFKELIQAAVALNVGGSTPKSSSKPEAKPKPATKANPAAKAKPGAKDSKPAKAKYGDKVVLLSGGNPQIAKADGDAPVQAYIAAMPGWKSALGKRLDALIVKNVPHVQKAVKWNSPFYGIEGQGWFLTTHCLTKYVKVTFFKGKSLQPMPPGATPKSGESRWLDIYEGDKLDEAQMSKWIKQAAAIPGWVP